MQSEHDLGNSVNQPRPYIMRLPKSHRLVIDWYPNVLKIEDEPKNQATFVRNNDINQDLSQRQDSSPDRALPIT